VEGLGSKKPKARSFWNKIPVEVKEQVVQQALEQTELSPRELAYRITDTQELSRFVDYYNNHRYHESLNNVTPADVYFRRHREILTKRDQTKRKTLALRKKQKLNTRVA
jgi:transposase InsO family protein